MKIGVIIGSVRDTRNGAQVGNWVYDFASKRGVDGVEYGLVDLKEFDLPLLGTTPNEAQGEAIKRWSETIASFDAYVFVSPEYNRALGGAFKNALDYLKPEVANKAVGFVSYGGLGGSFAIASLRGIVAELQMASVRTMVTFSLMTDFENFSVFKPADYHQSNVNAMLDEVTAWGKALKTLR